MSIWVDLWRRMQAEAQNNPNYSEQFRNQVGSAPNPFRPNPQPPQGTNSSWLGPPGGWRAANPNRPENRYSGPPPFMMDAPVNPPQGTNGSWLGPPGGWRAANPNRPENRYSGPPPFMMDAPVTIADMIYSAPQEQTSPEVETPWDRYRYGYGGDY